MDAFPITRDELADFAQQMAWVAFFAGALGGMVLVAVCSVLMSALDWVFNRAERRGRVEGARTRAAIRGMGQRPMSGLSHPAFPDQGAGGELGCLSKFGARSTQAQGDGGRAVEHGADPRTPALDQANPPSCLKDKRAEGAPALRCAHGDGGYSGETPSVLQELTPSQPLPLLSPLSPFPVLSSAHGDGGYSGETPSVLQELPPSQPLSR